MKTFDEALETFTFKTGDPADLERAKLHAEKLLGVIKDAVEHPQVSTFCLLQLGLSAPVSLQYIETISEIHEPSAALILVAMRIAFGLGVGVGVEMERQELTL